MTVRVGLVGYGLGGEVFHAPLIAATPAMSLDAIVTTNAERAGRATERYPAASIVPDVASLLATDPDLIVIATPNRGHVPIALEAIDRGLHVVIDKPIAPSSAEARRVADAAAGRGTLLSVFQNRRLDGDFLTVRALLETAGARNGRPVRVAVRALGTDPRRRVA